MAETADVAQHARQVDDERRERRVDILTLVILLAFATSFTFLYVHVLYLGHPVPLFAFPPYDTGYFGGEFPTSPKILGVHTFSDFYEMWARARDPNPYLPNDGDLLPASPYLPFAHVIALPLKLLPLGVATPVYLGLLVFGLLTLTWYTVRFLPQLTRARTAVVLVLFCGPVLMLVDRGNIEGVLILLIWGAILLAAADRWVWAAILLAAAIAMKGHPGLFLVLFLLERKFWQAALCVVLAAAMTYLPLLLMPGSIGDSYDAMRIVQNNIDLALSSNLNYNFERKGPADPGRRAAGRRLGLRRPRAVLHDGRGRRGPGTLGVDPLAAPAALADGCCHRRRNAPARTVLERVPRANHADPRHAVPCRRRTHPAWLADTRLLRVAHRAEGPPPHPDE